MFKLITLRRRTIALAGVAAVVAFAATPAHAAEATATLGSSATVTSNCTVTTTAVGFGNINATANVDTDATGTFSVTCTNGTGWTAKANAGGVTGATIADRKMANGTELLKYNLYTDTGRTILFGDGGVGAGVTIGGTGTGSAQSNTIYARVPSGQTAAKALTYTDSVTVTVTYT